MHKTNSQIKFKTSMLNSSLWDDSDTYIILSGTITIDGEGNDNTAKLADERNKKVTFKNCLPCTYCISEINNTQIRQKI